MLTVFRFSGRVRSDQLPAHHEMFEEIRAVYPRDPATFVSTHNDVNPANLLYDGNRLWLIDWESAKRNDPFIDIAMVWITLAPTAELQTRAATGPELPAGRPRPGPSAPGEAAGPTPHRRRLARHRPPAEPVDLNAAMTLDEVNAAVGRGELVAGQPATFRAIGTALLRRAHEVRTSPAGTRALTLLGQS